MAPPSMRTGQLNSINSGSDDDHEMLLEEPLDEENSKNELGTINGVYVPCLLNILGAVLFMRIGYSVGYAGWMGTLIIFLFSEFVTVLTALSFSKIVTNGTMGGGGAYYMISRSIGAPFGGATGVLFYLCYVANCAFNATAFVEDIVDTYLPEESPKNQHIYGLYIFHGTMFILMLIGVGGAGAFAKVNTLLFLALFIAIITTFGSLLFMDDRVLENVYKEYNSTGNCTKQDPNIPNQFNGNISFTKPNLANFKANFWWVGHGANHTAGEPGYEPAWSEYSNNLVTVLALIFTSTCGVMEGANLSGDLKDPAKSLPKGTLMAKCTSFTTYIIFTTLLASCFDRDALQCEYLILQKAAVSPTFVVVGIAMACLSTSLGALFGAARIMQAIARDGLFPIPYFAKGTKEGDEPRRALIFTYVFANIFAYFGNNSVAGLGDILTDFFLTAYALVNLSQLLLELSQAPNYRPTFKWATWWTSLFAFVLSIAMMWYLNLKYAGVTTVMWVFLFIVIYQTAHEKDWGDISQGILFKNITSQLQSLMPRKNCAKFWRATFMVLVQEHDLPLLQMCNHMTKDGLFIIGTAHVDNGTGVPTNNSTPTGRMPITTEALLPKFKSQHNVVKGSWLWLVEQTGLRAFVNVGAGSNLIDTYRTMISSAGLGGLTPNTVVVPYHESNRGAPSGNFVARVNEGLAAAASGMRLRKNKNLSIVAKCCIPPATCKVCNHPASQNSVLGCTSNLEYLTLLQYTLGFEKNLMVVRNSKALDSLFAKHRAKASASYTTPTFIDAWIVGGWEIETIEKQVALLVQHAHLMNASLGKHTTLRIIQVVDGYLKEEKIAIQAKLDELVHLTRIPQKPEVLLVDALPSNTSGASTASYISRGVSVDVGQFVGLNATVAANSSNTSLVLLSMPSLPDEMTAQVADAFMSGLDALTTALPPVVLLHKGDPSTVISLAI